MNTLKVSFDTNTGAVALPLKFKLFRPTVASVEPMEITCVVQPEFGGVAGSVMAHAPEQFATMSLLASAAVAV